MPAAIRIRSMILATLLAVGWPGCGAEPEPVTASMQRPVQQSATSPCHIGGCAGQICSAVPDVITPCGWQPRYRCLSFSSCGGFGPGGSCGWKQTPEMAACIASQRR